MAVQAREIMKLEARIRERARLKVCMMEVKALEAMVACLGSITRVSMLYMDKLLEESSKARDRVWIVVKSGRCRMIPREEIQGSRVVDRRLRRGRESRGQRARMWGMAGVETSTI
jgi:hypothetical protein